MHICKNSNKFDLLSVFLTVLFSIFFIIVPIIPDIQITRPKLLAIELLIFLSVATIIFIFIINATICFRKTKVYVPISFMLGYIILHYYFAYDHAISFTELKRWILCFLVFFIISLINSKYYKILLLSWIFGSGLAVLYGYSQHYGRVWIFEVPKMDRVMSMFGNPIFFAVHIVNYLPILISLILFYFDKNIYRKNKLSNIMKIFGLLFIFIISLLTLYYTKTRASFIGFTISICVLIYLTIRSRKKFVYLISILIVFVIFIFYTKDIWSRQQAHFLIWLDTIKMWLSKPIYGIGIGKFHLEFINFASDNLRSIWPQKQFIINDAHNEYVQLLAETGVVGFLLFCSIFIIFFYEVFKCKNRINDITISENEVKFRDKNLGIKNFLSTEFFKKKYLVYGLVSAIIGVLVQNFFSVDMRFIISGVYIFASMGLVIGEICELKELELNFFKKRFIKVLLIFFTIFILGIVSVDVSQKRIIFLSYASVSKKGINFSIEDIGNGVLQHILRPYVAKYKLDKQQDFFDEKILDKEKTLQELLELKKKFPDKGIIYEKIAWIYAKEKQFDLAIENYFLAIKLNPQSFAAYNNLGNIMFLTGQRQNAIKAYSRSIEINPQQVDARLNLGIVYYYEGQLDLASQQFGKVLELDPKNEKAIIMLKRMRE